MLSLLVAILFSPQRSETVDIPGTKLKVELVTIPAGKAVLSGAEGEPPREVPLRSFLLGAREVAWAEFNAFRTRPAPKDIDGVTRPTNADSYFGDSNMPPEFYSDPKRSVTNVRWHSAVQYCEWLSKKTGRYFRLPTEAEWEYAARAGSDKPAPDDLKTTAWYGENSEKRTHAGGELKPNAFGLYDMLGNVWEVVLEYHSPPEYNPVLKGGCWSSPARELKYAHRQTIPYKWFDEDQNLPRSVWWITTPDHSVGFRVACVGDASDRKDREAYAAKVEATIKESKERRIKTGQSFAFYRTVTGEIRNAGDRTLEEVELRVHYLDEDGSPHLTDQKGSKPGRGCFGKCWPVLASSYGDAAARAPLKPGETRAFALDLPSSWDLDTDKDAKIRFGAAVTALKFAR